MKYCQNEKQKKRTKMVMCQSLVLCHRVRLALRLALGSELGFSQDFDLKIFYSILF